MGREKIPTNAENYAIIRSGKPVEFSMPFDPLTPEQFKLLLLEYRWIKIRYITAIGEIKGTFSIDLACNPDYVEAILGSKKVF